MTKKNSLPPETHGMILGRPQSGKSAMMIGSLLTVEQSLMLGLPIEPDAIPAEAKTKILAYDDDGQPITEADIMMEYNRPPEDWMFATGLPPVGYDGDPEEWAWIEQVRARRRGPPEAK